MRELHKELGDKSLTLRASFKASLKLAEKVGDPLLIAREANVEALMLNSGLNYDPKWKFTVKNVPDIIWIGVSEAGSKMTLEQVQELVFEAGFAQARDIALEYLALIVGPAPEEPVEGEQSTQGK